MKLHLSTPSVLHHVLSNFWNAFLLVVFTTLPKPKIYSADSKPDFVKVRAYLDSAIKKDGFQRHPMQRSVLTLFSLFNDRRARVQLFNIFSSSRRFKQVLPQGSVPAPLLFLFYINNLASSLNDDAVISLFADDVSFLTTAFKKEDAEAAAQAVVSSVLNWSQEWKLNLNADKSEVCPFSTWFNDSTW